MKQRKKNRKQHHIQNQSKLLPWYLINDLECRVQNFLTSLNTSHEIKKVGKILAKPAPEKRKSYHN